ncbi:MAG: sulfotransferase [Rudaea sp.]
MSDPTLPVDTLLDSFIAQAAGDGVAIAIRALNLRLVAANTDTVELSQQVIGGLLRRGQAVAAVAVADAAIARSPQALDLRYWRGNALRLSAQPVAAESALRVVLEQAPEHRDAALSLAHLLREQGRMLAAGEVLVASLHARNSDVEEIRSALVFLRECGNYSQAHALAQQALQRWPNNAGIAALAGEFALAIGAFESARDCLRTALTEDPGNSASWLRLGYCQRYLRRDDPDLRRIENAWHNPMLSEQARTCAGFALGKALDDLADCAGAVNVLRQANAMAAVQANWSVQDWRRFVKMRLKSATLPSVAACEDFTPVFIVGLPRTGTTLLATLLGRSEYVRERGELNWIDGMYRMLDAQDRLGDPAALEKVAQLVAAQMRRDDTPARFYIDKNPLNFRYLDLIAALFPQAKIIHCTRELRDAALSLWMQHFAHADLGFAYDFSAISEFAHGYRQLFAHWRKALNLPIFELDYSALTSDTEATTQKLAEFLGLGVLPAGTLTGTPAQAIATASVWQARQPVHARSIGRWRAYVPYLPELSSRFPE